MSVSGGFPNRGTPWNIGHGIGIVSGARVYGAIAPAITGRRHQQADQDQHAQSDYRHRRACRAGHLVAQQQPRAYCDQAQRPVLRQPPELRSTRCAEHRALDERAEADQDDSGQDGQTAAGRAAMAYTARNPRPRKTKNAPPAAGPKSMPVSVTQTKLPKPSRMPAGTA